MSCPSLEGQRKRQRAISGQVIRKTAEPNDKLYSLDSRIFKREITPGISHISDVVLLRKDYESHLSSVAID